jgi:hypothetical protein
MAVKLNSRNLKEQLEKNLKAILVDCNNYTLKVGIPATVTNTKKSIVKMNKKGERKRKIVKSDVPSSVAEYASKNEFGSFSENIPSRQFMRDTFKGESMSRIRKVANKIFTEIAQANRGAKEALEKLGLYIAGAVQTTINKGKFEKNSPVTIALKGSAKPLIDTGTMKRALTAWVTSKTGIE